jgi:hypothetical protein
MMHGSPVEYKRLKGLEAISYDHDAHCIKYKRGLDGGRRLAIPNFREVTVSNTSNCPGSLTISVGDKKELKNPNQLGGQSE